MKFFTSGAESRKRSGDCKAVFEKIEHFPTSERLRRFLPGVTARQEHFHRVLRPAFGVAGTHPQGLPARQPRSGRSPVVTSKHSITPGDTQCGQRRRKHCNRPADFRGPAPLFGNRMQRPWRLLPLKRRAEGPWAGGRTVLSALSEPSRHNGGSRFSEDAWLRPVGAARRSLSVPARPMPSPRLLLILAAPGQQGRLKKRGPVRSNQIPPDQELPDCLQP